MPRRLSDETFYTLAACVDPTVDPNIFFPVGDANSVGWNVAVGEAMKVCARCPVEAQEECLEREGSGERYGVRAGMTERQRTRYMKERSA